MDRNEIISAWQQAINKSRKEQPNWPVHVAAQAGMVANASGKLLGTALRKKYVPSENPETETDHLKIEAIHTMAMCWRFLENLK